MSTNFLIIRCAILRKIVLHACFYIGHSRDRGSCLQKKHYSLLKGLGNISSNTKSFFLSRRNNVSYSNGMRHNDVHNVKVKFYVIVLRELEFLAELIQTNYIDQL